MSTFLITGFTGQVGSQLADYVLQHSNHAVIGLMRWQEPLDNVYHLCGRINKSDGVTVQYADLNDFTSLYRLIKSYKPEFISHLGAQSYPKTSFDIPIETLQTNIIGTCNLLEAIRLSREASPEYSPVVHICSSSEVYGRAKPGNPITEDTPFHGASPYSISKIGTDYLGRFYGEAYGIRTFVTRMGSHSGPRRSDVFFESTVAKQIALIEAGLQDPVIFVGNLESVRTYQDARDAVRAYYMLMMAAERNEFSPGECFNIAGEEVFKLTEVINLLISKSCCKNIKLEIDPNRLRPIDADYQMFDNTKVKSVIPWSPKISAEQMFTDLLNHWRVQVASGRVPLCR